MLPTLITAEKNSLWDLWSKTKLGEWRLINMLSNQMAGLQFLHSRFPSSKENCSAILVRFSTLAAFKGVNFGFQNFPASFAGRRFLGIEIHPSEKLPWLRKFALHIFLLPAVLSSRIALSLCSVPTGAQAHQWPLRGSARWSQPHLPAGGPFGCQVGEFPRCHKGNDFPRARLRLRCVPTTETNPSH